MALNYLCRHDVSDDDCRKCGKHGIILSCPANCPDFWDIRKDMPEAALKLRSELMEKAGWQDWLPWE